MENALVQDDRTSFPVRGLAVMTTLETNWLYHELSISIHRKTHVPLGGTHSVPDTSSPLRLCNWLVFCFVLAAEFEKKPEKMFMFKWDKHLFGFDAW